jgi:hypothetical protein
MPNFAVGIPSGVSVSVAKVSSKAINAITAIDPEINSG